MLGIITADDIIDVAEQKATEEIQKMGGVETLDAPYLEVGFWSMVRKRSPGRRQIYATRTATSRP